MSKREFNFPLATLIRQAGRLNAALADPTFGAAVVARLPGTFVADFGTLTGKILAAANKYATQLGEHGWMASDARALESAIGALAAMTSSRKRARRKAPA